MKIYLTIIIVTLTISISCSNKEHKKSNIKKSFVREKIGQELKIPNKIKAINGNKLIYDSISVFTSPVKIFTYVNFDCNYCYEELKKYRTLINNINNNYSKNISLIILGHSWNNNLSGYYTFFENNSDFPFPIFIDKKMKFLEINNIPDKKVLHTFVIDNNNKIYLVGNPFVNKKMKKLYLEEIKDMIK